MPKNKKLNKINSKYKKNKKRLHILFEKYEGGKICISYPMFNNTF